jgi:hypothetical protein
MASLKKGKTSVSYVKMDGDLRTVIDFPQNIDLINASLSVDGELIHIVERVTSMATGLIGYKSVVYNVVDLARTNDVIYSTPVDAVFIGKPKNHHLILFTNGKIANFEIIFTKSVIERQKHSSFTSAIWMNYVSNAVSVISENGVYQELRPGQNYSLTPSETARFELHPDAKLPAELAMTPFLDAMQPIIRTSTFRFFPLRDRSKIESKKRICLVQQLYHKNSFLSFHISTWPGNFEQTISIPDVPADFPICCAQFRSVVLLFAPNSFVCIIDLAHKIPIFSLLPYKCFAWLGCGPLAETISGHNIIMDVDTGEYFTIGVTFGHAELFARELLRGSFTVQSFGRGVLESFAIIAERMQNPEIITDLIAMISANFDYLAAVVFFREFFRPLEYESPEISLTSSVKLRRRSNRIPKESFQELQEFDTLYPTANRKSRSEWLRERWAELRGTTEQRKAKIVNILDTQIRVILLLRKAIEKWIECSKPNLFWLFVVTVYVFTETVECGVAEIPGLRDSLPGMLSEVLPFHVARQFVCHGVMVVGNSEEEREMDFWRERIPILGVSEEIADFGSGMYSPTRRESVDYENGGEWVDNGGENCE